MKTLCTKGYKISQADNKALAEYLLTTPKAWAESALKGMINKAVKTILKDWFETYKEKQTDSVSASLAVIIPGIISMQEFKPYGIQVPETPIVKRKQPQTEEIWEGGFNVEDYEKQALDAYYANPEEMLEYFMENKVYQRKKAFVEKYEKELIKDPQVTSIPAHHDDLIELVTSKPNYKNRKSSES